MVYSPDILHRLFFIFHYPSLPKTWILRSGKGSSLRDISIGSCSKLLVVSVQILYLGSYITGFDQNGGSMEKSKTFWWKNFMYADDNILKALGDLGKDCLLKSYVCYLLLNLSIICIYCKVLKSVIVNCWNNKTIYVKAVRTIDYNSFALHCNEKEGQVNCKFSENQPKDSL